MRKGVFIKERKRVEKYTIDGKFVKEYESINQGAKENNISSVNLVNHLKKKQKTAGGFLWKYKNNSE
jgi:hypothetical protein